MEINIKNKVAVVTGAANGIGSVIALKLASEGVRLVLWDTDEQGLITLTKQIKEIGVDVLYSICDVSNEQQVIESIKLVENQYNSIDILVANAGIAKFARVIEMDVNEWDKVFAVNSRGVFLCVKHIAPLMIKNNIGRIIIASSYAAIIPSVDSAAYAASKSALVSLTRVLSAELGPYNITVNAYAPGMIPTAMSNIENLSDERKENMLNTLAIREWGKAEDIASLIIFLASDQARYITGTLIDTSGGKFSVQFQSLARN
jgi:3-oxoacyl-[acyl-carrier protein] reductase